jgi:hypothetical protein
VIRPLIVLGVSRSGTTLLRVMLDRSPGIAIPDESFFVPLLARRHRGIVDTERFLDDLRRIPMLRAWGISAEDVAPRLHSGTSTGEAVSAIFESYAQRVAKPRWGDKTPMYMRHVSMLERLFPDAQFVHLVRDGRDAALSLLEMPEGTFTRTWAHPRSPAQFACMWRKEVGDARALGRRVGAGRYLEVRYEDLVAEPALVVREICEFAGIPFELEMVEYAGQVDVSEKPHQQRLLQSPTIGVRSWREEMTADDVGVFEAIAGDLLDELGYELRDTPPHGRSTRTLAARGWYDLRLGAWNAATSAVQRSPLWRRRHPPLSR